ncbi:hypothetical protein M501DRAFT_668413 [Patellaria atrata CBS 101060]|uniref:CCHC-type domain-containing protein n=1 Tax=Patellaria atrata CBS 101060 TaxID=1346257 RepID=A0A9P4S2T6_9PEZI|nr:hypothetical protein M501DRAFT_668413 [Patellaria atrata CBS 101060]
MYPFLESEEDDVTSIRLMRFLDQIYKDPNRRLKARDELKELRLSRDQWKEELHDRLYDSLRLTMAEAVGNDEISFQKYYSKATTQARELERSGKASKARRESQKRGKPTRTTSTSTTTNRTLYRLGSGGTTPPITPQVTEQTITVRKFTGNCFNCGKAGHSALECRGPKKTTEVKSVQKDEH